MDDYEVDDILAEEEYSFNPMDYLRSGYQSVAYSVAYLGYLVQSYGWHILFASLAFHYIFKKFIRPILEGSYGTYENYKKRKEEREYDAKYHKNPDLFSARISAQQEAAQKLQEKYDQQAKEHQAKLKEKEDLKKQEVLNLLNEGGHRLGGSSNNDGKPKSLRLEYNPLMGPGPSSNYRPPKKSKCGGGGCGR